MEEQPVIVDECQELKNIKYKTMLLTGAPLHETKSSNDISNFTDYNWRTAFYRGVLWHQLRVQLFHRCDG